MELLLALSLRVLASSLVREARIGPGLCVRLLDRLALLSDAASHIFEVGWVAWLDHIVCCQNTAGCDELELFAEFQVGLVRRLVVVEEHEVNVLQRAAVMQPLDRSITGADLDLDDVAEASEGHKRLDHCSENRITLQTPIALTTSLADGIAKKKARVTNVPTKFNLPCRSAKKARLRGNLQAANHCLRFDLCDQVAHNLALVFADIHEVLLRASILVNGCKNVFWRAPDLLNVGMGVNEV